jgi:hypothetical protein
MPAAPQGHAHETPTTVSGLEGVAGPKALFSGVVIQPVPVAALIPQRFQLDKAPVYPMDGTNDSAAKRGSASQAHALGRPSPPPHSISSSPAADRIRTEVPHNPAVATQKSYDSTSQGVEGIASKLSHGSIIPRSAKIRAAAPGRGSFRRSGTCTAEILAKHPQEWFATGSRAASASQPSTDSRRTEQSPHSPRGLPTRFGGGCGGRPPSLPGPAERGRPVPGWA